MDEAPSPTGQPEPGPFLYDCPYCGLIVQLYATEPHITLIDIRVHNRQHGW